MPLPPPTPSPTRPRNLQIGFEQSTVAKQNIEQMLRTSRLGKIFDVSVIPFPVKESFLYCLLVLEGFCGIVFLDSTQF